jgi:hypothetical protein
MNFEIAIPSYQRPKKCKETTLAYLHSQQIDPTRITLFLKNEEELKAYAEEISGIKMVVCLNRNLNEKKTFINQYYPEGQNVLNMDDDIKEVVFLDPTRRFVSVINRLFDLLQEEKCSLFGVYPVHTSNNYYLKERVAVGLNFCIGQLSGFINQKIVFPPLFCGKEDKWLSLYLYEKEGKTLRYEGACCKSNNNAPGGLTEFRATGEIEEEAKALVALFPSLTKFKVKANGDPDVVFNRLPRVFRPLEESHTPPSQTGL